MKRDEYILETLLAAKIQNEYLKADNFSIMPTGTFKRSYSTDVEAMNSSDETGHEVYEINREGLYDMLPEGLFHEIKSNRGGVDYAKNSARYRKEERDARTFFMPFEQEFFRNRLWFELIELNTSLNNISLETETFYKEFWRLDTSVFSEEQCSSLLAILPHLHDIVGNTPAIAYCIEMVIGEPVEIDLCFDGDVVSVANFQCELNDAHLGRNTTLGDACYDDDPQFKVSIGPLSPQKIFDFLPGNRSDKVLTKLYEYFFPVEASVQTVLNLSGWEDGLTLNELEKEAGVLGFTSILG